MENLIISNMNKINLEVLKENRLRLAPIDLRETFNKNILIGSSNNMINDFNMGGIK